MRHTYRAKCDGGRKGIVEWELKTNDKGKLCFTMLGEYHGGGGQCIDTIAEMAPKDEKMQRMKATWERWHLNDMNAGCEHQRELGWKNCPGHYGDGTETCTEQEEKRQQPLKAEDFPLGHPFVIGSAHMKGDSMYLDPEVAPCAMPECRKPYAEHVTAEALKEYQKPKKHYYCAEGKRGVPCPICGYKYGHAWLHEDLPAEVVAEIESWSACEAVTV